MASDYEAFYVMEQDADGVLSAVGSGVTVEIHDLDADSSLGNVSTDANGQVAAGSVSPDAGTRIAFRVEDYDGLAGAVIQITT